MALFEDVGFCKRAADQGVCPELVQSVEDMIANVCVDLSRTTDGRGSKNVAVDEVRHVLFGQRAIDTGIYEATNELTCLLLDRHVLHIVPPEQEINLAFVCVAFLKMAVDGKFAPLCVRSPSIVLDAIGEVLVLAHLTSAGAALELARDRGGAVLADLNRVVDNYPRARVELLGLLGVMCVPNAAPLAGVVVHAFRRIFPKIQSCAERNARATEKYPYAHASVGDNVVSAARVLWKKFFVAVRNGWFQHEHIGVFFEAVNLLAPQDLVNQDMFIPSLRTMASGLPRAIDWKSYAKQHEQTEQAWIPPDGDPSLFDGCATATAAQFAELVKACRKHCTLFSYAGFVGQSMVSLCCERTGGVLAVARYMIDNMDTILAPLAPGVQWDVAQEPHTAWANVAMQLLVCSPHPEAETEQLLALVLQQHPEISRLVDEFISAYSEFNKSWSFCHDHWKFIYAKFLRVATDIGHRSQQLAIPGLGFDKVEWSNINFVACDSSAWKASTGWREECARSDQIEGRRQAFWVLPGRRVLVVVSRVYRPKVYANNAWHTVNIFIGDKFSLSAILTDILIRLRIYNTSFLPRPVFVKYQRRQLPPRQWFDNLLLVFLLLRGIGKHAQVAPLPKEICAIVVGYFSVADLNLRPAGCNTVYASGPQVSVDSRCNLTRVCQGVDMKGCGL